MRRVTLTIAGTMFMLLLDSSILNTSLPPMATALGVRPLALSAAVTVYLLALAAVLPLASWLGDRYGLRRMLAAAIALFTLSSLACGLAQGATQLVAARVFQGIGAGLMMPTGRTLAMRGARKEDLIGITALLTWPALIAPVLGPPLGGLITTYASWRWNFLINVPLGALAAALILRWVPHDAHTERRPLDRMGAAMSAFGLMLFLGGLEGIGHALAAREGAGAAVLAGAAGLALLAATVRHLRRTPNPVLSLAPFAHRSFLAATVGGGMFTAMCLHSTPFVLPLFFQLALGRDALEAGGLLLPYFLGNLSIKSVTTPILVRFGFRRVLLVAGWCSAAAIGSFAFVGPATPWALLIALLFAAGSVRSMFLTAVNTVMYAEVPAAQRGAASSLATMSMQTANALGIAVAAIALAAAQIAQGHAQVGLVEFQWVFAAMGALCALATATFVRLPHDTGLEMTRGAA